MQSSTVTNRAVLDEIRRLVAESSLRKVAAKVGISAPYLSDILLERRGISDNVAEAFGFERFVKTEVVFKKRKL